MKSDLLKRLWKDRNQIIEGVVNSVIIRDEIEKIANVRKEICQSNQCGYYDQYGTSEKVVMKGMSACGVCGCNLNLLTHSMSSKCSLHEINQESLWPAELTTEEENEL